MKFFPASTALRLKQSETVFLSKFTVHWTLPNAQSKFSARYPSTMPKNRLNDVLLLKIGVHIGDVVHRDHDIYGDGVNIAARIEPLAGPGCICVSIDVERQIRNKLDAHFEKLAPTELKNISIPMDLFRIIPPWEKRAPIVAATENESTRASRKYLWDGRCIGFRSNDRRRLVVGGQNRQNGDITGSNDGFERRGGDFCQSIAVLPFENLSRDPDNAFFTEGVQDEILTRLAKVADLNVIARTSTRKFKSAPENLQDIAKQLGVANILEGSVQNPAIKCA